jgi:hypothetical protein
MDMKKHVLIFFFIISILVDMEKEGGSCKIERDITKGGR